MALIKETLFPGQSRRGSGRKDGEDGRWGGQSWPNGLSNQLFMVKAEPISQTFFHHFQKFCLYSLLRSPIFYYLAAGKGEVEESGD